ncbi:MAG TPA: alpha-amylase [Anaerolineae bacterium]|nr:alpha-amylase [Anaerolineae bacterium]
MTLRHLFSLTLILLLIACASPSGTIDTVTPTLSTPETESPDWWHTAIFYEIFVRSFYDSDADGIGDFNGITQKLDYLESLGINAIWLMPIHPSPSYHGYDVINYYAVNTEYGTMDDFKNLLNEAHKREIRIIIDLVINHTSSEHPWFKDANANLDSPYRDFYVWSNETGVGNWHQGQNGYYYGYFWGGMPDLNYQNPDVTTAILNITDYWLNDIGIDGFRIDAVKHLIEEDGKVENTPATHEWLKEFFIAYKEKNPQAYTIGEVFGAGSSIVKQYTGTELDHIFNFEMAYGFVNSTNGGANSGVNSAIKFAYQDMPDFNFATFLTNHDQNRVMSVFNGNVDKAKMASFLMLTSAGTPYIYYGEEIGMQGEKPDEDIRLPMQWSADEFAGFSTVQPWRNPYKDSNNPQFDYTQINVELQTGDSTSLLEHYRTLIGLRKSNSALQTGDTILLETNNSGIYAILRKDANGTFLILANLKDEAITDYAIEFEGAQLAESIVSVETVYGENQAAPIERSGETFIYKPFENLNPYAMYILKLNQ